jgi:uncharacterized protein
MRSQSRTSGKIVFLEKGRVHGPGAERRSPVASIDGEQSEVVDANASRGGDSPPARSEEFEDPQGRLDAPGTEFRPDDRFYRVERSWMTLQRASGSIRVLILWSLFAAGLGIVTVAVDAERIIPLLWGGWLLTVVTAFLHAWIWPALAYRRLLYRVSETRLQIRRGYLWRNVHDVPRSRIQHIDIGQGPIERSFDLSHVVVYTAGTTSASVKLDGLRASIATSLRDVLLVERGDDAV